jgi:putative FmdB family regulatory protein
MPIYDFACQTEDCSEEGVELEKLCKVNEIKDCEECGEPMKKLIRAPDVKKVPPVSWSTWKI